MDMYKILKEYTEIPCPADHEKRISERFMKDLPPYTARADASIVYNVEVIPELRATAEMNGIPYQNAIFENYGSRGARPNLICPPTRYSHTSFEMVHLGDMRTL